MGNFFEVGEGGERGMLDGVKLCIENMGTSW